jgi:hypothetical protein
MNNLDKRILEITKVYDNNGETYDRYTVFTPDGAVYGMSEGGEGFNQYIGDYTEVEMGEHLGTKLDSVPESIKNAVLNRMVDSQFVDLFQYFELMPENVSAIFDMYYEMSGGDWDYDNLSKLQEELKELGYTFDYGLDAEPYGLRPIELSLNQLKDFEEYKNGGSIYNKGRSWHLDRQKHNKSESWEKPMRKRKKRYETGGGLDKFMIGDLVFAKDEGMNGLVGLVVSDARKNEDGVIEYDILYRGYRGDIIPTAENDLVDIRQGYMDIAQNKSDISSYTSIAEKRGITINPVYQQVIDEEYEYKNGGGVKYPTELKVGSVLEGVGFPMLKGIDGGNYYTIVEMDNYSATLVKSDKNGNKKGSKKVRHYLSSIEGGIKTASRGDNNGILVVKYSKGGGVGDKQVIEFEYKGKNHKFSFVPDEPDMWTSFESHGLVFDVHYDEDYNEIVVYEVIDNEAQLGKSVYSKRIMKKGGGVDDKKLYEIVFEDVFSFAIAKREANLTNSQYNKALQQIKDKTIVVDRFNKSSGVHEQLRIKEIKPIFAKGGGINSGRDNLFKSQEPHEQKYKRKREWKEYKKEGWFGDWFRDGGSMDDYTKSLGMVRVKFADPKYNYETNVSGSITEEQARNYFVGKMFDVGVYPNQNMQRVIDIDFYTKGTYDIGGGVEDSATIIIISQNNPLSKQIGTGWKDIYNSYGVSLVEKDGKKYIVFSYNYVSQVDKYVIKDDISYVMKTYNISNVEWNNLSDKRYALEMSKNEYKNGGNIGNEEEMVKSNLYNGEISCEKLTEIIGCKPNYPYQIVGAIKLEKCYLRPYYKLV